MSKIIDKQTCEHYIWGDNCDGWIFANKPQLSIKIEAMPSETRENLHFHNNAQQFFYILKGTATFYINGIQYVVHAQQGILIEPEYEHYIENNTSEKIDFLVVSQPTTNNDRTNL